MGKRTRGSRHDAPHGGPRAKVDTRAAAAIAEERSGSASSAATEQPAHAGPAPRAARDSRHLHDHGRIDDPEPDADFGRLRAEIDGLVALVERHDPALRRDLFDSYVTAVTEFGATAEQLEAVEVELGYDDDVEDVEDVEDDPPGHVRDERVVAPPRSAARAAHGGRSGVDLASVTGEAAADGYERGDDETPHEPRRRRRSDAVDEEAPAGRPSTSWDEDGVHRALAALATAHPPRTNLQRTALIAVAHLGAGHDSVSPEEFARAYAALEWRAPSNGRAHLRAAVRSGAIVAAADGRFAASETSVRELG